MKTKTKSDHMIPKVQVVHKPLAQIVGKKPPLPVMRKGKGC